MNKSKFQEQFHLSEGDYIQSLDFLNWYRYYFIIKEILNTSRNKILEVGVGNGIVKNCLTPLVDTYTTMDINTKLAPDIVANVLEIQPQLKKKFDCIIIADVVEHIPFKRLRTIIENLKNYLIDGGFILITIPHRRSNFLFMSPTYKLHVFTVPTGFLSMGGFYRRFIKRKIWIDPHHEWEIGDGKIKKKDVEKVFRQAGVKTDGFRKLLYVDWWRLSNH